MKELNIFQAIIRNDRLCIQQLIDDDDTVVDQRSKVSQDTALHITSRNGSAHVVSQIVKLRPYLVDARNANQETPLDAACVRGNLEVLEILLAVKLWDPQSVENALLLACKFGNRQLVMRLVENSNINVDLSYLQVAISNGQIDLVQELIETWPSLAEKADENGLNLLHCACKFGQPKIVRMILEVYPALAKAYDYNGFTPLHLAVLVHSSISVEILNEFDELDPFAFQPLTGQYDNVLHLAVRHNQQFEVFLTLIQILGESNQDIIQSRDKTGNTLLHLAVFGKCLEIGKYLITKSTKEHLQTTNDEGNSVLVILNGFGDQQDFVTQSLRDCLLQKLELEDYHVQDSLADSESTTEMTKGKDQMSNYQSTKSSPILSPQHSNVSSHKEKDEKKGNGQEHSSTHRKDKKKEKRLYKAVEEIADYIKQEMACRNDRQEKRMYEMHMESLQNVRNTINIIAILIATVTFTGCLSPPGGFFQQGFHIGKPVLGQTMAFKVFAISNDIALFLSLTIVVVLSSIIPFRTTPMRKLLALMHKVLWLALSFLAVAYIAARWATTLQVRNQKWTYGIVLAVCGGLLAFTFLALIIKLINGKLKNGKWRKEGNVPVTSFSVVSDIHTQAFSGVL